MTRSISLEEKKFIALVRAKKYNEGVVICLKDEHGGPVVSGRDFEEAKDKFIRALSLSVSLKNLFTFKKVLDSAESKDENEINTTNFNEEDVEFETT